MVQNDLEKALISISACKQEGVVKLIQYLETDLLFFFAVDKDLNLSQQQKWKPILDMFYQTFGISLQITQGLDVPQQEQSLYDTFKVYLKNMDDVSFVCLYKLALCMRSVLLAWAMINEKISPEEAYEAALLEELWQAQRWGNVDEAEKKRLEIKTEIFDTYAFWKNKKAA